MNLCISNSINQVPTRYLDNQNGSNLVIDLMFLQLITLEFNNHMIYLEWRLSSDHAPLTINIMIFEKHIQTKKHTIVKNNKEEKNFLAELIKSIKVLNTEYILSKENLEWIVQDFTDNTDKIWFKHPKIVSITKHLKL